MSENKTKQPEFDVFISHASENHHEATEICEFLEQRGLRCWIAPRNVVQSNEYPDEIIKGVKNSKSLILLLSSHTADSQYVSMEVERAVHYRRRIFTIRLEEVGVPENLELFLGMPHWIDKWAADYQSRLESIPSILEGVVAPSIQETPPSSLKKILHFTKKNSLGLISLAILLFFTALFLNNRVSTPETPEMVEYLEDFDDELFRVSASRAWKNAPIALKLDGFSKALGGKKMLAPELMNQSFKIVFTFDNGQTETIVSSLMQAQVNVDESLPVANSVSVRLVDLHSDENSELMTFPVPELKLLVSQGAADKAALTKKAINNSGSLRCDTKLNSVPAFAVCRIGDAIQTKSLAELQAVIDRIVFSDATKQMTNIVTLDPLKTQGDIVASVQEGKLYFMPPRTNERINFQYHFSDGSKSELMQATQYSQGSIARKLSSETSEAPPLFLSSQLNTRFMGLAPIVSSDVSRITWSVYPGVENEMTKTQAFFHSDDIPVNDLEENDVITVAYFDQSGNKNSFTYYSELNKAEQANNLATNKKNPQELISCNAFLCSFTWLNATQADIDLIEDISIGIDARNLFSISREELSELVLEMEKRRGSMLKRERDKNGNKPHSSLSFGTPVNIGGPTLLQRLEKPSNIQVNQTWKKRENTRNSPIFYYSWPLSPIFIEILWVDGTTSKPLVYKVPQN